MSESSKAAELALAEAQENLETAIELDDQAEINIAEEAVKAASLAIENLEPEIDSEIENAPEPEVKSKEKPETCGKCEIVFSSNRCSGCVNYK